MTSRKQSTTSNSPLEVLIQGVQQTPFGVVITDSQQEDNPIVYVNKGFESLTGFVADDILGKNCRFLQQDDTQQPGLYDLKKAITKGVSHSTVLRNYTANGELFYNQLSVSPVSIRNHLYFIGFQRDVSERELQRHRLLKQTDSLEQSLFSFTHEFNNRLARKTGLIELLRDELSLSGNTKQLFDALSKEIYSDSKFASEELSYIRDVNRSYDIRRVELATPAKDLVESYNQSTQGVDVRLDVSGEVFGFTNEYVYKKALTNLLSNATKYTFQGEIVVSAVYQQEHARVDVRDTGVGIAPDALDEIFEPFNEVRKQQQVANGNGVGLSMVKRDVESVGGRIGVTSSVGVGSVFSLYFPRAQ